MKTISERIKEEKLKTANIIEEPVAVEVYDEVSDTKPVEVFEEEKPINLTEKTKVELQVMLEQHNIKYKTSWNKTKLIKAIEEN